MAYELDFTEQDLVEAERGYPVPGWYAAVIEDAYEDHDKPDSFLLKIKITAGKWIGHVMTERFDDINSISDEAQKVVKKKVLIWGPRLEVIPRGTAGRVAIDWTLAIGKEVAIQVYLDRYEQPKNSGIWKEATKIKFDGIYQRYDERVPAEIRSQRPVGVPAPGGPPSNAAAIEAQARAAVSPTVSVPTQIAARGAVDFGSL